MGAALSAPSPAALLESKGGCSSGAPLLHTGAGASGSPDGGEPEKVVVFPERWREKENRLAKQSPHGHLPGWRLLPCIVKANDDLRQEQFVSQLLAQFAAIFRASKVPVWLKAYDILAVNPSAGLIQAIPDTMSLDSLKKNDPNYTTLTAWFEQQFKWGVRGPDRLRVARTNFARSLAAYSIVCYILQIKDRHNGNILVDRKGAFLYAWCSWPVLPLLCYAHVCAMPKPLLPPPPPPSHTKSPRPTHTNNPRSHHAH